MNIELRLLISLVISCMLVQIVFIRSDRRVPSKLGFIYKYFILLAGTLIESSFLVNKLTIYMYNGNDNIYFHKKHHTEFYT